MDPTARFLLEGFDQQLAYHWVAWAAIVNRVLFPVVRLRRAQLVDPGDRRTGAFYVPAPIQNALVLLITVLVAIGAAAYFKKPVPHEVVAGMSAILFSAVVHGATKNRSPASEESS